MKNKKVIIKEALELLDKGYSDREVILIIEAKYNLTNIDYIKLIFEAVKLLVLKKVGF